MIFLDLDGVVVDFCAAAYRAHGRTCAINEPTKYDFFEDWGMTADEFWGPIDAIGPEFWSTIPLYPWANELIGLCGKDFVIATTNSIHPVSASGKVSAIQSIFGERFRNYMITPRKWLLGAPGRLLIDDNEMNCEKFRDYGGDAILFPAPWNENREFCDQRMDFVRQSIDSWKAAVA